MGAYKTFIIFTHMFSASLYSIDKTKKKEHCSNSRLNVYNFYLGEGGGMQGRALVQFFGHQEGRLIKVGTF